ncbi:MAG: hypothetical protein NT148_01025 [Candidatus Nealsonbacteria bacterium]|nr:hypothetical protein [Candidatus Nealsonbacteria bacterium]
MNNRVIKSPWIVGNLSLRPGNAVQISIVAYEHSAGVPARFCAGLIPAIDVSKQLKQNAFESVVRVIDPTPIANYCNGWQPKQSQLKDLIAKFFNDNGVEFFFDEAEPIGNGALEVLGALAAELEYAKDEKVADMVERIRESGKRHGGDLGSDNSTLYMAAHPFSWLDMHHPLIWKKFYPPDGYHFVNLMSTSEERFTVVRKFLQRRRPDLCTNNNPTDRFMTICNTPCYIPLDGEPTLADLINHGHDWCHSRYCEFKAIGNHHARACKDFEALMAFGR